MVVTAMGMVGTQRTADAVAEDLAEMVNDI
jgi:hypothetical protein